MQKNQPLSGGRSDTYVHGGECRKLNSFRASLVVGQFVMLLVKNVYLVCFIAASWLCSDFMKKGVLHSEICWKHICKFMYHWRYPFINESSNVVMLLEKWIK